MMRLVYKETQSRQSIHTSETGETFQRSQFTCPFSGLPGIIAAVLLVENRLEINGRVPWGMHATIHVENTTRQRAA